MGAPRCHNCLYLICDPELWLRWMWKGEPIVPRCANHPRWPGQLHDVPGIACRNYRPRPVLPRGDAVRLIPLGDGHYAYVDAADYEWLSKHTWRFDNGYAARWEKGKRVLMHREIMQPPEGMVVDHIDSNRSNNCRINLRNCTHAENQRNQRKRHGSRSRFKGVLYDKQRHRWFAVCRARGKYHWRGYFDDEIEAARAYDRMAVELCGEFARVNFPNEWPPEHRAEVYATAQAEREELLRKAARKARACKPQATRRKRQTSKQGQGRKASGKKKKPHAGTRGRRGTGDRRQRTEDERRPPKRPAQRRPR